MTRLTISSAANPKDVRLDTEDFDVIARELATLGARVERWQATPPPAPERVPGRDPLRLCARDRPTEDGARLYRRRRRQHQAEHSELAGAAAEVSRRAHPPRRRSPLFRRGQRGILYPCRRPGPPGRRRGRRSPLRPEGDAAVVDGGENADFSCIRVFTDPEGWDAPYTGDEIWRTFPLYERRRKRNGSPMLDRPTRPYRIFADRDVLDHLDDLPQVRAVLGGAKGTGGCATWPTAISTRSSLVDGREGGVCVKQALPYVRVAGESWPLDVRRANYEAAYLTRLAPHVGPFAKLHHYDPAIHDRDGEARAAHRPAQGADRGRALSESARGHRGIRRPAAFHTSDLAVPFERKAADVALFSQNLALQRITVDLVFADRIEVWRNKATAPLALGRGAASRSRVEEGGRRVAPALSHQRAVVAARRSAFRVGDGDARDTQVIDGEFAWVGPDGLDVGNFIAHYVMAW